jgi:hypothetical protein
MIEDVFKVCNIILNKNHFGWGLTPARAGLLFKTAQLRIYEELTDDYRRAKIRVAQHKPEMSLPKIAQALSTIYNVADLTKASEKFALPSDVLMIESVFVDDIKIDEVSMSEYKALNRNHLTKPTEDEPIYVNYGSYIKVYPDTIGSVGSVAFSEVGLGYYKTPADPVLAYTTTGDFEIIDPSESVDFTLPESFFDKIVVYTLQMIGVTIREEAVAQFSQNEESKELQKNNA